MKVVSITREKATVVLSEGELAFLGSAINETLEAVEEWEFQTRTGETQKHAMEVRAQLSKILSDMQKA